MADHSSNRGDRGPGGSSRSGRDEQPPSNRHARSASSEGRGPDRPRAVRSISAGRGTDRRRGYGSSEQDRTDRGTGATTEGRPRRDDRQRSGHQGRRPDRDGQGSRGRRDPRTDLRDRGSRDDRGARPGQEARADRPIEPRVPEGITGRELDRETRDELRGLSQETAERVSRHLVAAHLLEESDPETAHAHARFAARLGGRVGAVREAFGIIAYRAGDYRTAARELRTSLRITGRTDVLPLIADSERGLGRPERALDIAASDDAANLSVGAAIELMIVVAGAYADTGDVHTALRTLDIPALRHKVDGRWQVRLWVAYADLLERADRPDEAKRWLTLAADADRDGLTDAAERVGRPGPAPVEDPTWSDGEQVSVLDAYDPAADEVPAEPEAGTESGTDETSDDETSDGETADTAAGAVRSGRAGESA